MVTVLFTIYTNKVGTAKCDRHKRPANKVFAYMEYFASTFSKS